MKSENVSLTIEGEPGEEVRVVYRSNADPQPPPVWNGNLGPDGRVTISVPRAYLVVLGRHGEAVLRLFETESTSETVRFKDAAT